MTTPKGRKVLINEVEDHAYFPPYPATKDEGILHFIPIPDHQLTITSTKKKEERDSIYAICNPLMSNV